MKTTNDTTDRIETCANHKAKILVYVVLYHHIVEDHLMKLLCQNILKMEMLYVTYCNKRECECVSNTAIDMIY